MKLSWDITKLKDAVENSTCFSDVCRYLEIPIRGRTFDTLRKHIKDQNISIQHFDIKSASMKGIKQYHSKKKLQESDVFVVNSIHSIHTVKRWAKKIIPPTQCSICEMEPSWNNKPLTLQLDHINGNNKDNRKENLRWICPNCHSQTDTYCGKKSWKKTPSQINPNWRNEPRINSRKVCRPSKAKLEKLIEENSWVSLGEMFGVSDNAVRKWARSYGLIG